MPIRNADWRRGFVEGQGCLTGEPIQKRSGAGFAALSLTASGRRALGGGPQLWKGTWTLPVLSYFQNHIYWQRDLSFYLLQEIDPSCYLG